jgi:ribosomal protein L31
MYQSDEKPNIGRYDVFYEVSYCALQFALILCWYHGSKLCNYLFVMSETDKYRQCHPMWNFVYSKVNSEKLLEEAKQNPDKLINTIINDSMFKRCFQQDVDLENKKQKLKTTLLSIQSPEYSFEFAEEFKYLFPECNFNECKLKSNTFALHDYYKCHPFYKDFNDQVGGFDTLSDALDNPDKIVDNIFDEYKDCISKHDNIEEKKNQLKKIIPTLKTPYESYKFSMAATELFPNCNKNSCDETKTKKIMKTYSDCHPFYKDIDNQINKATSVTMDEKESINYIFEKYNDCISDDENYETKKQNMKQMIYDMKSPNDSYKVSLISANMFPKCNTNICYKN